MTWFNAKAMPTNDIDYSCYIKVIQFIYQIIYIYIDRDHITPLVIDSLKADIDTHAHAHTQTHTHIHTYTQTCIPMFRTEAILSG